MAGTGRSGVGLRSERGPVLLAIMLSTGLVAIDSTIIATAGPSIVASLGGFAQFPWLFSVYLLAQAVSVPIYGKLADQVGRRPIMLLGIGLFLIGSVLCGAAWNMGVLIVFRAVQGLGAGAVQPMSMTIIGDLYTVRERARVTGYISSVWGISAVIGPTLGGLFSDLLSWRWIFFVNIPLCIAAAVMLLRNFHEKVTRRRHHIDYTGTILLTAGSTLVILGLLEGGQGWRWDSIAGIGVPVAGLLLLVGFVQVERRADEPVLPLWVFTRRVLVTSSLVSLAVGAALIGLTTYVPTYAQISLGTSALVAGFALATLVVGWPITSSLAGRLYLRIGFRATSLIGCVLTVAGAAGTLTLDADSSGLDACRLVLRDRCRARAGGKPDADRRSVDGRLGRAGGGYRKQLVLPVDGQRHGRRGVRRRGERRPAGGYRAHRPHGRRCHPPGVRGGATGVAADDRRGRRDARRAGTRRASSARVIGRR